MTAYWLSRFWFIQRPSEGGDTVFKKSAVAHLDAVLFMQLFRAFKREAVQFLGAKNLTLSHLPLEALRAVQTRTASCKRDRKTVE